MSTKNNNHSNNSISNSNLTGHMSDEFHIKSHLNSSLDLREIKVSEELIQRTLKAIKEEESDRIDKDVTEDSLQSPHKRIEWIKYARILAGTAAAVIILVVGINSAGMGKKGSPDMNVSIVSEKSAEDRIMASDSTGTAAAGMETNESEGEAPKFKEFAMSKDSDPSSEAANEEDASTDSSALADSNDTSVLKNSASPTASADTYAFNDRSSSDSAQSPGPTNMPGGYHAEAGTGSAEEQMGIAAIAGDGNLAENLSFQDIVPATLVQISSITITDVTDKRETALTMQVDIQDFYNTLEQQKYSTGTAIDNSYRYTIKAYDSDSKGLFTLEVGDTVTISPVQDGKQEENVYQTSNSEAFLKLITAYCK